MPAQQAMVPALVPVSQLPRAFALTSTFLRIAIIGGPALGGSSTRWDRRGVRRLPGAASSSRRSSSVRSSGIRPPETRSALRWRRSSPASASSGTRSRCWARSRSTSSRAAGRRYGLLPIYAKDVLDYGSVGSGPAARRILRRRAGDGALPRSASAATPRRAPDVRVGGGVWTGDNRLRLSHNFLLSLVALAVSGGADMVSVVIRQTLVQLDTPDAMRGRVSAVNSTFIGASNELGEFRAGRQRSGWAGRRGGGGRRRDAGRRGAVVAVVSVARASGQVDAEGVRASLRTWIAAAGNRRVDSH
jgi:hypothetical protein